MKPQSYEIGERVLVYNPKKRRGKFANYVVKKGRSRSIVIHIDRLRKLPVDVEADSTGRSEHDGVVVGSPAAAA